MGFKKDWLNFVGGLPERRADAHPFKVAAWFFWRGATWARGPGWSWFRRSPGPVVLVLVATYYLYQVLPWSDWLSLKYWQTGGNNTSYSEVVRNLGLLAAALIGLGFGIWRVWTAHRQVSVAEQGHITDRFSTAVEHMGDEQLPVRLGGIYALWRLTEEASRWSIGSRFATASDVRSVIDIYCAFVRDPPPLPIKPPAAPVPEPSEGAAIPPKPAKLRSDVQAIMSLIGDQKSGYRKHLPDGYRLDLEGANLSNATLTGANLSKVDLSDAVLRGVHFWYADFTDAYFIAADFTGAHLGEANFSDSDFTGAVLADANLSGADLRGADFNFVDFTNADLTGSNLSGADLSGADLRKADLRDANLTLVNFAEAKNIPDLSKALMDSKNPPKNLP